ncbi:MAG: TIGR01777 family oxidoreductase, partial [Gemmatimonadota bacterium]
MRVCIVGATGFVGAPLVRELSQRGDTCVVLTRGSRDLWRNKRVEVVAADLSKLGSWQQHISGCDAVINLAGARIIDPTRRWTADRKKLLRSSRIDLTHNLAMAICEAKQRPSALLNASAVGYYGSRDDDVIDERSGPGKDFLAELCVDWEAAAMGAGSNVAVTLLRTGMVLGNGGGVLGSLLPLFKTGLGGPWGHGNQWWSWIHLADEVGLILHALDRGVTGPINLTAPKPVTVNEFAEALGSGLRRPSLFRAPEAMLRIALGESASALMASQRV